MDTRSVLVETTAELLWERGYTATSPKLIQARASVGQGSMYHHFAGKADLAAAAMRYSADSMRAAAEEVLSGKGSAVERIGAFLDLERDPLAGCRMGRLVQDPDVTEQPILRAPAADFFTWLLGRVSEVLAEGVRERELRTDCDLEAAAALVVAAVQGGFVLSRALADPETFRQATRGAKQAIAALRVTP
jgi:AcrR family transcriptional regulator